MIRGSRKALNVHKSEYSKRKQRASREGDKYPSCLIVELSCKKLRKYKERIRNWLEERTTKVLGFEDDILIGTLESFLLKDTEEEEHILNDMLDGKDLFELSLPFIGEEKNKAFIEELWSFLIDISVSEETQKSRTNEVKLSRRKRYKREYNSSSSEDSRPSERRKHRRGRS